MSSGDKLALGAIAALAAVAAARNRGSRSSTLDEKTIKVLADYFSGRTFPSAKQAQAAVFYRWDRNRTKHGPKSAPAGDLSALSKQVPVHEVKPGKWKVGPPIDPQTTLLYQVQNRKIEPIIIQELDDKFSIRDYVRDPKGVQDLIDTLKTEIEEHAGHYGKNSWGSPSGWTFNIKAHNAYDIPGWVTDKLGHEWVNEIVSEHALDSINLLIEEIQDPTHPLYQDWFDGEYSVEGRSGGYLVLKHGMYDTFESDADLDYIDDFFAINIFGHSRIGIPLDDLVDLESTINDAILALTQRQRLEDYIEEAIAEFNNSFDEDYWEDYLINTQDYTKEEIELLKQGRDPHDDEGWEG
jgi:hypothetical protein